VKETAKQVRLACRGCNWHTFCDDDDILALLRNAGTLRRATECSREMLLELLRSHANKMTCDSCDRVGLTVATDTKDANDDFDDGDWNEVRLCRGCRKPIPDERLELFPNEVLCASCKEQGVSPAGPTEQEYCERCGGLMKMQQSRSGGISRYVMRCSDCGR